VGAVAKLFPAYTQADWRRAAEAALNGAALETLVSETADGVRIDPVYPPGEGPRAIRPDGRWRVIARLDHPNADEANAQALDDLANGADGLQVVSSGALGAYGFGLRQFDSATLHKALDGATLEDVPDAGGALVRSVESGSVAAQAGLRANDIIVGANRGRVGSMRELRERARSVAVLVLEVRRGNSVLLIPLR